MRGLLTKCVFEAKMAKEINDYLKLLLDCMKTMRPHRGNFPSNRAGCQDKINEGTKFCG